MLTCSAQVQRKDETGRWMRLDHPVWGDVSTLGIIICDMWDDHWCKGAARRVAELAPRIEQFTSALRSRGVTILHCPSNTMAYYAENPARLRVQQAPEAAPRVPMEAWVKRLEGEPTLPFDDSDGGCFCGGGCTYKRPYHKQHDAITIDDARDGIGDGVDVYNFIRQQGITTLFYVGVHANMCVLGRAFGIRQMLRQGVRCVLVRDLTDTMYNPAMPPYVDHFDANDLLAAHVERYLCPTITSNKLVGGYPFRFVEDYRLL